MTVRPRSRRQWEYLFRERRDDGYALVVPFTDERVASAPEELREPYTAEDWLLLSEEARVAHAKQWVFGQVLDAMPDRPAPMPDPGPHRRIPRWIY